MRATISLLVTGLLLGSLAVDRQVMANSLPGLQQSTPNSSRLSAVPNNPKKAPKVPYRGSGRRELMEYFSKVDPFV